MVDDRSGYQPVSAGLDGNRNASRQVDSANLRDQQLQDRGATDQDHEQ